MARDGDCRNRGPLVAEELHSVRNWKRNGFIYEWMTCGFIAWLLYLFTYWGSGDDEVSITWKIRKSKLTYMKKKCTQMKMCENNIWRGRIISPRENELCQKITSLHKIASFSLWSLSKPPLSSKQSFRQHCRFKKMGFARRLSVCTG